MRNHAFLQNNEVVKVALISDETYVEESSKYQCIIDISDYQIQPQVGWKLEGNQLFSNNNIYVKIYDFMTSLLPVDTSIPPVACDYVTGLNTKLHRKSILVKGECDAEEFYEHCDGTTYSNLIIRESHVFTRNALGFAIKRDTLITWYNSDGQPNTVTKNLPKFYSQAEQIEEGKVRRSNLINALQMPIIGLISLAVTGTTSPTLAVLIEGRNFLFTYKVQFDSYMGESNKEILACLSDSNNPNYISNTNWTWIDYMTPYGVTIRNYLINALTI
jgi:hypothetical protein